MLCSAKLIWVWSICVVIGVVFFPAVVYVDLKKKILFSDNGDCSCASFFDYRFSDSDLFFFIMSRTICGRFSHFLHTLLHSYSIFFRSKLHIIQTIVRFENKKSMELKIDQSQKWCTSINCYPVMHLCPSYFAIGNLTRKSIRSKKMFHFWRTR